MIAFIMKVEGCKGHATCRVYDQWMGATLWWHHGVNDCRGLAHNREQALVFTDYELLKSKGGLMPSPLVRDFIRRMHGYREGRLLVEFDERAERMRLRPV